MLTVVSVNTKNGNDANAPDTLTSNIYAWRDGAVQSSISFDENTGSSSNTVWNTSYSLDGLGQLVSAAIADGKTRTVTYTNDEAGQVLRRSENLPSNAPSGQTGTPNEVYYRFAGRQMGMTGNNGTNDQTAPQSVTERGTVSPPNPGTFRGGSVIGSPYADFLGSYDPVNSFQQGSAAGSYTVRSGDTLSGIAAALYGDSS